MGETIHTFEDHAVGVVHGLPACAEAWSELVRLGVPESDLGVVVSDRELRAASEGVLAPLSGSSVTMDRVDVGRALLHASHGYPAELIGAGSAGTARLSFDGLLSEREGRALVDAIVAAGASLWVRTRAPDEASRAAAVLLRVSTERVRTFSRPAGPPST